MALQDAGSSDTPNHLQTWTLKQTPYFEEGTMLVT